MNGESALAASVARLRRGLEQVREAHGLPTGGCYKIRAGVEALLEDRLAERELDLSRGKEADADSRAARRELRVWIVKALVRAAVVALCVMSAGAAWNAKAIAAVLAGVKP